MRGLLRLLPIVLALTLAGCGAPITVAPFTAEDAAKMAAAANFPHEIYRVEPGDALQIRYTFHPEVKPDDVVVRPDGKVTAQLVGELVVAGMTTAEVERTLVERTSSQLRNPVVSVTVTRFSEKQIYVGGEVGKPGLLPYRKGLTPLQAVIASGGFRDTARIDTVILLRPGSDSTFISRTLNLAEATSGGVQEPVVLAPHDIIIVPKSGIAEVNLWVKQYLTDTVPWVRFAPVPWAN